MKFTLIMQNGDHKVTHEFECVVLDEFNEYTKDFLKGCGFVIGEENESSNV